MFKVLGIVLQSLTSLLSHGRLFFLSLFPLLLGIGSFFLSLLVFFWYRDGIAHMFFGPSSSEASSWLLFAGNILTASIIAVIATLLSSEFLLDRFLLEACQILDLQIPANTAAKTPLSTYIVLLALRLFLITSLGVMAVVSFFVPGLHLLTWILSAIYMGFELTVTPLTSLNIPFSTQMNAILSHKFQVFILGAIFSFIFIIPLGGLLLLPLAYLSGLRLAEHLLQAPSPSNPLLPTQNRA